MLEVHMTAKSNLSPMCHSPTADLDFDFVKAQLTVESPGSSLTGGEKGIAKGLVKDKASTAFQTLKMQSSHLCLKNYAIFDQSNGQNTVILHPSWLHGLSHYKSVGPSSMWEVNRFFDGLQALKSRPVEAIVCDHSQVAQIPVFGNMTHIEQQVGKIQEGLVIDETRGETYSVKKQVLEKKAENESLNSVFHEDTEEINALLSSDDELSSTGHSPSDGALYDFNEATINISSTHMIGKKRKVEGSAMDEVDDADSGTVRTLPTSGRSGSLQFPICLDQNCSSGGVGGSDNLCNSKRGRFCVSGSANIKQNRQPGKQRLGLPGDGGLLDSPKRIKLKENVGKLKSIIPGGRLLDTAGVIGRTVQYVRCLQNKLRELEAARESGSNMHHSLDK